MRTLLTLILSTLVALPVWAKPAKVARGKARFLTVQQFRKLPHQKKVKYVQGMHEILAIMEKSQTVKFEVAEIRSLREQIAILMKELSPLPMAEAQDNACPRGQRTSPKLGICILINKNDGSTVFKSCSEQGEGWVYVPHPNGNSNKEKACIEDKVWKSLSKQQRVNFQKKIYDTPVTEVAEKPAASKPSTITKPAVSAKPAATGKGTVQLESAVISDGPGTRVLGQTAAGDQVKSPAQVKPKAQVIGQTAAGDQLLNPSRPSAVAAKAQVSFTCASGYSFSWEAGTCFLGETGKTAFTKCPGAKGDYEDIPHPQQTGSVACIPKGSWQQVVKAGRDQELKSGKYLSGLKNKSAEEQIAIVNGTSGSSDSGAEATTESEEPGAEVAATDSADENTSAPLDVPSTASTDSADTGTTEPQAAATSAASCEPLSCTPAPKGKKRDELLREWRKNDKYCVVAGFIKKRTVSFDKIGQKCQVPRNYKQAGMSIAHEDAEIHYCRTGYYCNPALFCLEQRKMRESDNKHVNLPLCVDKKDVVSDQITEACAKKYESVLKKGIVSWTGLNMETKDPNDLMPYNVKGQACGKDTSLDKEMEDLLTQTTERFTKMCVDGEFQQLFCTECMIIDKRLRDMNLLAVGEACNSKASTEEEMPPPPDGQPAEAVQEQEIDG